MATEKKSWNDMSRKEQYDFRKEERLMRRLENSTGIERDLVIKKILEEKNIKNPNAYRAEGKRLNNLASNFDFQQERELKKSYENKWSESSVGTESNVNRKNLKSEIEATFQGVQKLKAEKQRYGRLGTTQEISAFNSDINRKIKEAQLRERELKDSLSIFDSQYGEAQKSWISQTQSEDDRLAAYNEQKDEQEYVESKYGKGFQGDPGGNATGKMQMQMPPRNKPQQKQGQPKGMPQEMVQSPAKAQKRMRTLPYDARTGRSLSDTELNNFYRRDAALYRQVGGAPSEGLRNQNPYVNKEWNDSYNKKKRATEYSMANYQNPNAMSDYYQNLNF